MAEAILTVIFTSHSWYADEIVMPISWTDLVEEGGVVWLLTDEGLLFVCLLGGQRRRFLLYHVKK